MARLHEYQGKRLLQREGLAVPRGGPASTASQAADIARSLGCPVVLKIQAWTTGRAAIGGVAFAGTPAEAESQAARLLAMRVGQFPVTEVLVEERLDIARELFVSLSIDDRARAPVILVSLAGGSGIEARGGEVRRFACDVRAGPSRAEVDRFLAAPDLPASVRGGVAQAVEGVFRVARGNEARSVEVNPLVVTRDGRVIAADCRVTIDDYAVFRHAELGIDVARELDHPPTPLECAAYAVEQADHRGTFYFAQLATEPAPGSRGLAGFHGAGGGGSMMSMDAITAEGFTIADFCDTSGNPSPAKVYLAARIILSQPGLCGYFGSGSGVASQEQFWSAYGLAKAFWELELSVPAVIRLGGNSEDRAVEILQSACRGLPAPVEGYRKFDPPSKIAGRFAALAAESINGPWRPRPPRRPGFVGAPGAFSFPVKGGTVWIDAQAWVRDAAAMIARSWGLLRDDGGRPTPTVTPGEFAGKDSEMIACEVECRRDGIGGVFVEIIAPGLLEGDAVAR
jgi:succinyl-CoA synthetase beta subunit